MAKNCRNGVGAHLTRKHTGGVIILIGMATRFTHRHTHAYDARPATQRVVSSRAATATAGTPAAGRKRMMSIEVLRLLAIVCIAVFHAFLQQYVQAIWMGPHHPVSVAEPVSALASSRGAMWIVAMIMYCGAWGNHIFFMISGFFLIPRMCGAAGSSGYWNTQLRATGRRIAMILATVAFYLLLVLVAGHWAPSVSNDTQSASLVYELEFVWLYLAFVALAPAIAWVLNRLGACRSAVVAGAVLIAVYALNAYVACTWQAQYGQRTLLDWRKQMSAVSYALSFGLAGLLGWAVQHNSERRTEDKRHGVRHADRRPLWTIRGFWLCGVLVLLAVAKTVGSAIGTGLCFSLSEIAEYQMVNGSLITKISMLPAAAAMLLIIPGETGNHPFDAAEAETEICEGMLAEYSGAPLGVFKLSHAVKMLSLTSLFVALFLGGLGTGIMALDALLLFVLCAVITAVAISFVHAFTARLKIEQIFKYYWTVVSLLALISLVLAWYGL